MNVRVLFNHRHNGEFVKADDRVSKPELHEMARRAIDLIEMAELTAPQQIHEEN